MRVVTSTRWGTSNPMLTTMQSSLMLLSKVWCEWREHTSLWSTGMFFDHETDFYHSSDSLRALNSSMMITTCCKH